jgi:hypothetical protein
MAKRQPAVNVISLYDPQSAERLSNALTGYVCAFILKAVREPSMDSNAMVELGSDAQHSPELVVPESVLAEWLQGKRQAFVKVAKKSRRKT